MGTFSLTIRDRSKELSNLAVNIGPVTAGTLPGYLTTTGNLQTAIAALTLGVIAKNEMKVFSNIISTAIPTSPYANRESKLLVRYKDNTEYFDSPTNSIPNEGFGAVHNFEIPAPNLALTGILVAGSDFLNLAQTEVAAFVTAFQAVVLSPANGAVVVDSIELVGRNL